jgi:hypothetical protein
MPKLATVDLALSCMDSKSFARMDAKLQEAMTPKEQDTERATAALAWAQDLPADVGQDYLWNIRVISHREHISHREAGLAGSIISAFNRAMEQELARKYEQEHPSEWFGEIGKREILTLTVIGLRDLQSDWGSTTLVMFRNANGDKAKWFASGSAGMTIDKTYTVKATIKAHDEYQGSKQTLLSRVTVYDAELEAQQKANSKIIKSVLKKRYTCPHKDAPKYNYIDVPELERYAQNGRWSESCCAECYAAWVARQEAETAAVAA